MFRELTFVTDVVGLEGILEGLEFVGSALES